MNRIWTKKTSKHENNPEAIKENTAWLEKNINSFVEYNWYATNYKYLKSKIW